MEECQMTQVQEFQLLLSTEIYVEIDIGEIGLE